MKKSFQLEDLDCANCAAKMEQAINKMQGVTGATISFMQQRLTLEAPDECFEDIIKDVQKTMRKIEPDVRIVM